MSPVNVRNPGLLLLGLLICCSWALTLPGSSAGAAGDDQYTPPTLSGADILSRDRIDTELTGVSSEVPSICSGSKTGGLTETTLDIVPGRSGVGVIPAQLESSRLEAGKRYYSCVAVQNRGTETASFNLTTVEFVGSPNPDNPRIFEIRPVSVGRWIRPLKTIVSVPAGRAMEVPFAIDVPADVPGGTITGGIRFTQANPDGTANTSLTVSVVHNIYLTFPGGKSAPLDIRDIEAPRVLSKKKGQLSYRVKFVVQNEGSILDVWETKLDVKGLRRTVATARAGPSPLLPGEANRVEMKWDKLPWIGWYKPEVTVQSRSGERKVDVPRVFILPPMQYVVAMVAAVLLPILYLIYRWWRRRQEWLIYLAEEMEREDGDEEYAEEHVDHEEWDPNSRY